MNTINALTMSFQTPVHQTDRSIKYKTNAQQQINKQTPFSKFFQSVSSDRKMVSGDHQQGETMQKLESVLEALQELPKETLSPEELEILSTTLQMLSQQLIEKIDNQQGDNQFMTLFQQIEQELNELSALSTTGFGGSFPFMGGNRKKLFINFTKRI